MDTYKGRRVLSATAAIKAQAAVAIETRAFEDKPHWERESDRRRGRADAEAMSAALVAAFIANGDGVITCRERTPCIRSAQRFTKGSIEAIQRPIIARKGGAISYCAPRSRG